MHSGNSFCCQFSAFVIFSVYEQGNTKNETEREKRETFFLSVFCERKQKRKPFSFPVFCFPSFSWFLETTSATLTMNPETPHLAKKSQCEVSKFSNAISWKFWKTDIAAFCSQLHNCLSICSLKVALKTSQTRRMWHTCIGSFCNKHRKHYCT